ncbi:MAG: Hsp20/alpha crystallin family protein [Spirochaetia bacterium]
MRYMVRTRPNGHSTRENEFDRLYNAVFNEAPVWNTRQPLVNVSEQQDGYVLEAELPGMTDSDVDVRVEDNLLTITATRGEESEGESEEKPRYLIRERAAREYRRSFVLPKDADRSNIEARFKNGILYLDIKKLPEAKPRQIEIKGE